MPVSEQKQREAARRIDVAQKKSDLEKQMMQNSNIPSEITRLQQELDTLDKKDMEDRVKYETRIQAMS